MPLKKCFGLDWTGLGGWRGGGDMETKDCY